MSKGIFAFFFLWGLIAVVSILVRQSYKGDHMKVLFKILLFSGLTAFTAVAILTAFVILF